jgi:protein-S-isoprenylcysteine O-methyltransferase Ste14
VPEQHDEQLWWVTKFEQRRRQLEQLQQEQPKQPQQELQQQQQQQPTDGDSARPSAGQLVGAAGRALTLIVGCAALILWPAAVVPGGLSLPQPWLSFAAYVTFFTRGTLARCNAHGRLAPSSADAQRRSPWRTAALAAFVACMPLIHWPPVTALATRAAAAAASAATATTTNAAPLYAGSSGVALYDVLGSCLILSAAALNWAAAGALGPGYDRLVRPARLITSGPYAYVQHPIYISYALLFCGHALLHHSASGALLAAAVCAAYYWQRVRLEVALLQEAFGDEYKAYAARTARLMPCVW